jgi:hypothetical protein
LTVWPFDRLTVWPFDRLTVWSFDRLIVWSFDGCGRVCGRVCGLFWSFWFRLCMVWAIGKICLVGFAWVCELAGFLVSCAPGPCQASEKSGFARFVRCLWVSKFCPFWCLSLCCWFDGFNFVPVLATCWWRLGGSVLVTVWWRFGDVLVTSWRLRFGDGLVTFWWLQKLSKKLASWNTYSRSVGPAKSV